MRSIGFWLAVVFLFAVVCLMVGCAANPSQPDIVAHVTQAPPVEKPIPVPCLKADDVPAEPETAFTPDPGEWSAAQEEARAGHPNRLYAYVNKLTQQAIADVDALDAYVLRVNPMLIKCTVLPTEVKK